MVKALLVGQLTWNIPFCIFLITIATMYFTFLKGKNIRFISRQPFLFCLGICLLYLAIGSPLLTISHLSYSLHMIQMSALFFIVPPLLLLGTPHFMYKRFICIPSVKKFKTIGITPKVALIVFSLLFFIYHFPGILTYLTERAFIHQGYVSLLFILALFMWLPIASPNLTRRLSTQATKKYTIQSGLFITPACLLFIVSAFLDGMNNPLLSQLAIDLCLPTNIDSSQLLPPPFNTKYDQLFAGFLMIGLHKISLTATSNLANKSCKL